MVPHQCRQLGLADIRLGESAKVWSSLTTFPPNGMAPNALLFIENLPSFFNVSREEIPFFLFGSYRLIPEDPIST
jgi:hypothetical protein